MRKFAVLVSAGLVTVAAIWLLFRPLIEWPFGWQALPKPQAAQAAKATDAKYARLQAFLAEQYASGRYPSLSAAVSIDGKVVWSSAMGYADLRTLAPVTTRSQYRIGSSSKAVNATLAAILVNQGRLDVDAPITRYIDYFPDKGAPITTRQLLSHTAGIRHYGVCFCTPIWDYENTRHFDSVEAAVATFAGSPLLFKPGTAFAYSSYGTVLSSGVLEAAGGKPYLTLIQQQVAVPLGLAGLSADDRIIPCDHRVRPYELADGQFRDALATDDSIKWAGGGFVAAPEDLAKLGGAWMTNALFPPEVRTAFWTPQPLADGTPNPQNYALGWRVGEVALDDGTKVRVVHHNGTAKGAASSFMLFPDYGIAVSVMTNKGIHGGSDPFRGFAETLGLLIVTDDATD